MVDTYSELFVFLGNFQASNLFFSLQWNELESVTLSITDIVQLITIILDY